MNNKKNIQNVTLILMISTFVSKTFGFCRELIFSYYYGTSAISDAYLFSLTFSTIIIGFIGLGFNTGFIPMYNHIKQNESREEADRFTNDLTCIFIFISIFVIFIVLVLLEPIIHLLANGFDEYTTKMTIMFCRFSVFGIIATGLLYIYKGYLQLYNNYIIPSLVGIPLNIITIIGIYLSSSGNFYYLALGSLLATYAEVILLLPFLVKKGFKFRYKLNFKSKYIKRLFLVSVPLILSVSTNQIGVLIDKSLASKHIGGISGLSYAQLIISLITDIVTLSIITVSYPILTKKLQSGDTKGGLRELSESISLMLMILIPCFVGIFLYSEEIITFVFGRGAFDATSISLSTTILKAYSFGIVFVGLRQIFIRTFYAMQETIVPVKNSTIALIVNIVLSIILSNFIGISGLALGTSISTIISAFLMYTSLKKRMNTSIFEKKYIIEYLKIILCAALSFKAVNFIIDRMNYCGSLELLIIILTNLIIYSISLYMMKVEQFIMFVETIKDKLYNIKIHFIK